MKEADWSCTNKGGTQCVPHTFYQVWISRSHWLTFHTAPKKRKDGIWYGWYVDHIIVSDIFQNILDGDYWAVTIQRFLG